MLEQFGGTEGRRKVAHGLSAVCCTKLFLLLLPFPGKEAREESGTTGTESH